jgi:hypothetical protein
MAATNIIISKLAATDPTRRYRTKHKKDITLAAVEVNDPKLA